MSRDDRPAEEQPFTWGNLEVIKRIGVGTFAEVFVAHDAKLDTHVALKLLKREHIATERHRFLHEARRLAHVRHPNVVTVYGVDEHDGRPGMWMELLRGQSLEKRFEEQGRLAWREAAALGAEICSALAEIHATGVLHGDVKAANIVRDEDRHVLTDFGAAGEDLRSGLIQACDCGTPLVMAPEVFLRRSGLSRASDIYSLGVLLYRLVSGSYPVEARTREELQELHERGHSVPLHDRRADLPLGFVHVIERALEHDPRARFESAGKMGKALLASLQPKPGPETGGRALWAPRQKLLGVSIAILLAAVAFMVFDPFPFQIEATLYRLEDGVPRHLESGTEVRPGQQLGMRFEGSDDAYVYIFNEARRKYGKLYALFPLPYADLHNPLRGNREHRLPGRQEGLLIPWVLDQTGGTERFLVVASRERLPTIERWIERTSNEELLESLSALTLADTVRGTHPVPPLATSRLDDILRELGPQTKKLWWRVIELESETGHAEAHRE